MTLQKQKKQVISKDSFHYKHFKKKKSHHYLKPYYPYLPMLALIIVGSTILININKPTNFSISSLINSTNQARLSNNLNSVNLNKNLSVLAQDSASKIADRSTTSTSVGTVAEGFNNSSQIISAWLSNNSSRVQLLSGNLQNIGFGIAKTSNQSTKYVVVAMYQSTSGEVSHITFYVPPRQTGNKTNSNTTLSNQKLISRIILITNNTFYQELLIVGVFILATLFFLRHLIFFKKVLVQGEKILLNNIWLDIVVIVAIFIGVYFIQTVGFIS